MELVGSHGAEMLPKKTYIPDKGAPKSNGPKTKIPRRRKRSKTAPVIYIPSPSIPVLLGFVPSLEGFSSRRHRYLTQATPTDKKQLEIEEKQKDSFGKLLDKSGSKVDEKRHNCKCKAVRAIPNGRVVDIVSTRQFK